MRYGLPYMGSKNDLAERICGILPPADTLIDLFAGGCAITHRALLVGKWRRIIANDITDAPTLFKDAALGKYRDCDRWVGRDEFNAFKDVDPFVRLCWSFGNDQKTYLYSMEVEPYKRAVHRLMFAPDLHSRYWAFREVIRELDRLVPIARRKGEAKEKSLERLQSLERLERLESLESLERLERLESLEVVQGDYRDVAIPDGAVVYCDPPYWNTKKYLHGFDHEAFREWCAAQTAPLYVSEYGFDCDGFAVLAEWERAGSLSSKGVNYTLERLYANKAGMELAKRQMEFDYGEA